MRRTAFPLAVFTLLLATACDAGSDGAPVDRPGADDAGAEAAELAPINRSGVSGTARAVRGDGAATVTLSLQGLQPGLHYPAHVHEGRCSAGGPVAAPLGRIRAGEDGTGRLTTEVEPAVMPADSAGFIQVHGPDGEAIACADLDGPAGMQETLEEAVEAVRDPAGGDEDGGA